MTWFMPRILMTPNRNSGNYPSSGTTNIYIQNGYSARTGGMWDGYYNRMSARDAGIPITTDPRYNITSCNYYGMPSWLMKSMENNMLFSFVQNTFGSGGTYDPSSIFGNGGLFGGGSGGGCFGGGGCRCQ